MAKRAGKLSRRGFFRKALETSAAASLASAVPVEAAAAPPWPKVADGAIAIRVEGPAGLPPLGAPVEAAVPFAHGQLRGVGDWTVVSPVGKPVLTQVRPTTRWDDSSVRWLYVVFEAEEGPGDYILKKGRSPSSPDASRTLDADQQNVAEGKTFDFVLARHDGKVFRSSLAGDTLHKFVEETGPVRFVRRLEGRCRAEDGEGLFDFIIRSTFYRGRPEASLDVTWINATDKPSEQIRDIRITLPIDFDPNRLVIGCETGVYDGPFLKDWPVYILQEDHNQYWAKTLNPDGRIQNLSSGGCNGARAPGWLYLQNESRSLAVWVPDFWQQYPNEIAVKAGELSIGLWPERATEHLLSKPLLPAHPEGQGLYSMTKYWPIMPHPYQAFVDPAKKCLDARQGLAKTQTIILSFWTGHDGGPTFEKKWWSGALNPIRGHLDPVYVAATGALGPMAPYNPKDSHELERMFDESFGWLDRHIDHAKCYGKFDYGDFKYFTASTNYMCHPGTKWGEMGEMAREGYWHNNERDSLLGLLLYYFRTGDRKVWERCRIVARHLLDVDIRHHPHWGMWTHSYGHCYVALGEGGEPDHSWLLGLLVWAGVSGDPVAWDWALRCGERLRDFKADFTQVDARSTAVFLHMMCQFQAYTGDAKYLSAAKPAVSAFLKFQNPNGSWPAYMGNLRSPRIEGFVEHAVMALADYYSITGDGNVLKSLDRALAYLYKEDGSGTVEIGEAPLALYGLAILSAKTGEPRYARVARAVLEKIRQNQNLSSDPNGRGDVMAEWGVNNEEKAKDTGRPAQFLGQTRPLVPVGLLAYGQACLAALKFEENELSRNC
ncbi:MAG: hypothetical protein ACE145_04160 [Terriglobia bacterium]